MLKGRYEVREFLDNRIGIFIDGLCVGVVHNQEELKEWFSKRRPELKISQSLNTAIGKMKQ